MLAVLPTGGGKTRTAGHIARRELEKGRKIVWVAHRKELVDQAPVPAVTVQSLSSAPDCDLLIMDEAHHAVADSWYNLQSSSRVLGLTATPERADNIGLGHAFDAMVLGPSRKQLIRDGFLVPAEVIGPSTWVKKCADEPWKVWPKGKRGFVFAQNIAQSKQIATKLGGAHIDGGTPKKVRTEIVDAFKSGEIDVICNVDILTEGFDAPDAEVCMIARSCGSRSLYLQMIGRVTRPAPGKTKAIVYDLRGVTHQHGLPDDDYDWTLDGKGKSQTVPTVSMCSECGAYYMVRPKICTCGWEFPPSEEELLEIKKERLAQINATLTDQDKEDYLRRMISVARARGYNKAWAGYRYKARFGTWPKSLRQF